MTETYDARLDDARLLAWLRAAGIAVLVTAAVGSVHFAAPTLPEQSSTGTSEVSAP